MKNLVLGLLALVLTAGMALAADPMQSRYDNTITLTAPGGAVTKVNFNKDGTMSSLAADGTKISGKWAMKDGKLCVTLDTGPTAGKEGCNPFVERKVGDTWEVTLADGSKAKATMVAGR